MPLQARKRTGSRTGPAEFSDVESLVTRLRNDLAGEGYEFGLGPKTQEGFQRVYVNRSGRVDQFDAFLDLRIGPDSPGGPTIEMASGKPGTYGIPGFTRVVGDQKPTTTTTASTFKDFLRSAYASASEEGKPVQSRFWSVYQHGYAGYNLPASGAVMTPSSSSGQREFAARTVRYMVPEQERSDDFLKRVVKQANVGQIPGLEGYIPEVNQWNALVPGTMYVRKAATGVGGMDQWMGQVVRGVGSEFKSMSTVHEARNLANQPMIYQEGQLQFVRPSNPTQGWGVRQGWTRSSVVLPGESETRNVLSKRVGLSDVADLPGAALMSPNAMSINVGQRTEPGDWFRAGGPRAPMSELAEALQNQIYDRYVSQGKPNPAKVVYQGQAYDVQYGTKGSLRFRQASQARPVELYAMGEAQNLATNLGISSVRQMEQMIESGLDFSAVEGRRVRSGKGSFQIGASYGATIDEGAIYDQLMQQSAEMDAQGKPQTASTAYRIGGKRYRAVPGGFQEIRPITMSRKGYDIRAGRAQMFVPQYYDPASDEGTFSNVYREGLVETKTLVQNLQQRWKDVVDVRGYGVGGSGEEDSPAEVQMTMPIVGINPPSIKTAGTKAEIHTVEEQLSMELAGVGRQDIDFLTQEAKIPGRTLMSSFGLMNRKTQLAFMSRFLPNATGSTAVQDYISAKYKSMGRNVELNLEDMADIYRQAAGEAPGYSADVMFSGIWKQILNVDDPREARKMFSRFGVGVATDQMLATNTYSASEAANMQEIAQEALPEGRTSPVEFEKVKGGRFRLKQRVARGSAAVLQVGLSFTPEYQSQSQYLGPKAIMSLLENYPEAARAMGLAGSFHIKEGGEIREGFVGPLAGNPSEARKGWVDMWSWLSYQKDLNEFTPSIPKDSVVMTPALAGEVQSAMNVAATESTSEARINRLTAELHNIDVSRHGLKSSIDLANTFFVDPNTGTLIPKLSSIASVESYKEGVQEGQTRTYISDQYFRLLQATTLSSMSDQDKAYGAVVDARNRFYSRMANEFMPPESGFKGKEIYRNILGVDLPGTRGGRYAGMTGLEAGEAYADDDYIRKMLSNGNMYNAKEIASIMKYLNSHQDAYLPMLAQRFPDISGKFTFMPMKLRSKKFLEQRGVKVPDNLATRGTFFMTQTANRFFVGDFDADPAMQKVLPITNRDINNPENETGAWRLADPALQEEFDRQFAVYQEGNDAIGRALRGMFGDRGMDRSSESLDAARKNMADYMEAVITGKGSLPSRVGKVGETTLQELMAAGMSVKGFKGGMGVAYNRRTMTEDVMDAVLNASGGDPAHEEVRGKAYESGAMMYQLYLDRQKSVEGGYSPLETMLSTINIGGIGGNFGNSKYRITYRLSSQGREKRFEPNEGWTDAIYQQGFADSGNMLRSFMENLSRTPTDMLSNAQLAWGFAARGRASEVYEALEQADPTKPKSRFYALQDMMKKGAVGLASPFYMSALYNMVSLMQTKNPAAFEDPSIRLPWINGQVMSVKDIAATKEFRSARALQNLFVSGKGVIGASEIEELTQLGGSRMAIHALGVYNAWQQSTHGLAGAEEVQNKLGAQFENLARNASRAVMQSAPIIHASELGSLGGKDVLGWTPRNERYTGNTIYSVLARWMGIPEVFGDRDYGGNVLFKKVDYGYIDEDITEGSHIEQGNAFEKVFAKANEGKLHHIGQVERESGDWSPINRGNLTYSINTASGPLTITGIPDFVDYDEKQDKLVISDTKLARSDPRLNPDVARRVKSNKNRIQQIAYAYGLEKLASENDEDAWLEQMRHWKFDPTADRQKLLRMRSAAAAGKFSISLQPGYIDRQTGLQTYSPIEINYGDEERQELEDLAEGIASTTFSDRMVSIGAKEINRALKTPGAMPRGVVGMSRTGVNADLKKYGILEELARIPTARAAGGGSLDDSEKIIRVGEGGPEDIKISKRGVEIIPTNRTSEAQLARGMNDPLKGYMGSRFAGGVTMGVLPGFEEEPAPAAPQPAPAPEPAPAPAPAAAGFDYNQFSQALAAALKGAISVRMDFGKSAPANMVEQTRGLRLALDQLGSFAKQASGYEGAMRETLTGAFEDAGMEDLISPEMGISDLLTTANQQLAPGQYLPRLGKLMGQSKDMAKRAGSFQKLSRLIGGKSGEALLQYVPEGMQEQIARFQQMSDTADLQFPQVEQIAGAATIMNAMSQQQGVKPWIKDSMSGQDPAILEKYAASLQNLIASSDKLVNTQGKQLKLHEDYTNVLKESYQVEIQKKEIARQQAKEAAGDLFDAQGQLIAPQEMARRISRGQVTPEQLGAVEEYATSGRQISHLRDQMSDEMESRGMGGFFRKAFGGFGLMYMRSIAGLAGTGSYTGFSERTMMEQAYGQQFVNLGGQVPYSVQDRLRTIQAVQYGGQGGLLMQNTMANIMQNNQPLYNQAMSGIAGLSAFGMASWLLPEFGVKGKAGTFGALGVGLGVQTASNLLNIAGAASDVMGTSTALAARQQNGALGPNYGNLLGSLLAYGGSGALLGAGIGAPTVVGAPVGALIGGIGGAAYGAFNWYTSDYQKRAAEGNPEIQRQTEILSALANAGDRGIAPSRIFQQYGIAPSQQTSYMQQAGMVRANDLGGLPDQAKAAAFAYSLKTNQPMNIEQMRQYGNMLTAGYDVEKMSQSAMLMGGIGLGQINTGRFVYEQPQTMMGAVASQFGVASPLPGQQPMRRMVAAGTFGSAYTMAFMNATAGQPLLAEQVGAGMEFASGLGLAAQWNTTRQATPEEQAREDVSRYGAYGQMKGTAWGDIYKARLMDYYQRQALGMPTAEPKPGYQQYAQQALLNPALTPQQYQYQQDEINRNAMLTSTGQQVRSIWTGALGVSAGQADTLMAGMTDQAMASFRYQQASYGQQLQATLVGGGLSVERATQISGNAAMMSGPQYNQFKDMSQFKPLAIADWAMRDPRRLQTMQMMTVSGYGGQVPMSNLMLTDVNAQGALTGLPWGTSSLAMPGVSAGVMAGRVFGQDWQTNGMYGATGNDAINAMLGGIAAPWGAQLQGMQAMKLFQLNLSRDYARQQAGQQTAQLDLAMAFQTGVGLDKYAGTVNPQTGQPFGINTGGGGLWGVEDRLRDLSRAQTEYQFKTQARDINLQDRYFWQNYGLARTQSTMQRGWQMEDWSFQDQTRNLQWGWKVQDYQENVRFMTGRERRLAERQMGRETIMHNLEGDQIDKQRDRQKELWKLEDQRFDLQKKQHQESVQNARTDLAQARKFYEENKKLQDEQTKLNRAYWVEQQKLAREAAAASAAYAEKQYQLQLVMMALETYTQNAQGSLNRLNEVAMAEFIDLVDELNTSLTSLVTNVSNAGSGGGSGQPVQKRALGGAALAGQTYEVQEREAEFFRPNVTGEIIPLSKLRDPWAATTVTPPAVAPVSQPVTVTINIGNERLASFVIDAVDKEINL